jgi:hypothetical protein
MKLGNSIISALVVLAILSCTEKVERVGDGEAAISFRAHLTAPSTRGAVVEEAGDVAEAGGFEVWAFSHSEEWSVATTRATLMNGIPVTSSDGGASWSYGTEQNWPMGTRVSFFAYAPLGEATPLAANEDGTPQVSFEVDSLVSSQTDLLIATPVVNQNGSNYLSGGSVGIMFKHALARLSFSALRTDPADTRAITVKQITLGGVYGTGSTPLTDPAEWTLSGSATASYTVSVTGGTLASTTLTGTATTITTPSGYLFVLPQQIAGGASNPTMEVTLVIDGEELTFSSEVFSPDEWEASRSYNYQIGITPDDLQIVVIDPSLTLAEHTPSIIENTIYLTSDATQDTENLEFAMTTLNTINSQRATYGEYPRIGVYAANDVTHDITIDMATLATDSYTAGQYLILDLRKLVRTWNDDPETGSSAAVRLVNYSPEWSLEPSKQAPNDVDAATGATNLSPSDVITSRGSFILKKQ